MAAPTITKRAVPVPQLLIWTVPQLADMVGLRANAIYDRLDRDAGTVNLPGGATAPAHVDPSNGRWVFYRAEIEAALTGRGLAAARMAEVQA